MNASGLIIGGKVVPCARPVYNWHDHGMEFKPGDGARKRIPKKRIDLFVWHWTGGEGSAASLFRVLDKRELGIEFALDAYATIYQFADPIFVDTYDAGPYNPRSVGCEVTNYGFTMPGRPMPKGGEKRSTYTTVQNGRPRTFARFTADQLESAVALGDAVSAAIPSIPKRIPTDAKGILFPDTMKRAALASFTGHLGHYHLTDSKSDPGADLLGYMLTHGFGAAHV